MKDSTELSHNATIKLRPHDALVILSFLREFINDDVKYDPQFTAIRGAVDAYEKEVYKMSHAQLDDAIAEVEVNKLIGKCPPHGKQN